jgi:uncharacterized protein (TIGR03435 family)
MANHRTETALAALILIGSLRVSALGQSTPAGPTFEVASVKQNTSGDTNGMLRPSAGGRIDAVNMPLRQLIAFAYNLPPFRLLGAPDWTSTARYDIVAKLPVDPASATSGRDPLQDVRDAVRALLIDRFRVVAHQETRELDIYALVLARAGGRPSTAVKPSTVDCAAAALAARNGGAPPPPSASEPVFCGVRMSPGRIQVGGMPLAMFAPGLSGQVGRVVIDRTGLDGNWDFELTFTPAGVSADTPSNAASAVGDSPSIFTALQEQLGLKLESTKGPVDVTVIDRVERPTPD